MKHIKGAKNITVDVLPQYISANADGDDEARVNEIECYVSEIVSLMARIRG